MDYIYQPVVALEPCSPSRDLNTALRNFLKKVKEGVDSGELNMQLVETACWLERNGNAWKTFYTARDLAYDVGVMVDGQILEA